MTEEEKEKLFKLIDYYIMKMDDADWLTRSETVIDLWQQIKELKL